MIGMRNIRPLLFSGVAVIGFAMICPFRFGIAVGDSMEPTLHSGQPFLFTQFRPGILGASLKRGDVVVVKAGDRTMIKRVFALGHDQFWTFRSSRDTETFTPISMEMPIEHWRRRYPDFQYRQEHVPPGHVFLVGDNVSSFDSREFGAIAQKQIRGVVHWPSGDTGPPADSITVRYSLPPRPGEPA
jgi:signal peptidase I